MKRRAMMISRYGWMVLWLSIGVARGEPARHEAARERARPVLAERCGSCHDGARATAKPKALRVFDLREADLAARMSDAQLDAAIGRMSGAGSGADKEIVVEWVRAERARRKK
jgi:hypothetical protein